MALSRQGSVALCHAAQKTVTIHPAGVRCDESRLGEFTGYGDDWHDELEDDRMYGKRSASDKGWFDKEAKEAAGFYVMAERARPLDVAVREDIALTERYSERGGFLYPQATSRIRPNALG